MLQRALVLLFLTVVVALPAWLRPDFDGTEGRRVQIALEMLRFGDWLVPTLGHEPTWAKPPLHYWLLCVCAHLFGDGVISMRVPSVLGAFVAALFAGELLRSRFGVRAGWIGALGIACSPIVLFVWPTAEIDPLFASLTGMSLWALACGVADHRRGLLIASGVLGGLALLQKGPPYFLFAAGAWMVWWRHRRFRGFLLHVAPMLLVALAYYVPLFLWRVAPGEMLAVASDESVGRITTFTWRHVYQTPEYWLRAVTVQLPFVLWCFWEWRGARDARMSRVDLPLRMCSGAAVLAVVLLTFFPGRPTRYILPNVLLFTFAVTPAVTHFFAHRGPVPGFARGLCRAIGVAGALALSVVPFVPRAGAGGAALALGCAMLPVLATTPSRVVVAALALPVLAAWTVGLQRSVDWPHEARYRLAAGEVLRRELEARGALEDLATFGHLDSPLLLAAGVLPPGNESRRRVPDARWLLEEEGGGPAPSEAHVERFRLVLPFKTFVLHERRTKGQ